MPADGTVVFDIIGTCFSLDRPRRRREQAAPALDLLKARRIAVDRATDFELTDDRGRPWRLGERLAEGPVLLVFYRGDW